MASNSTKGFDRYPFMMHKSVMGRGCGYQSHVMCQCNTPPEATKTAQEPPKQVDQGWGSLTDQERSYVQAAIQYGAELGSPTAQKVLDKLFPF